MLELDKLTLVLGDGPFAPIRLVDASFVVELWRSGQRLPARQQLPHTAFFNGLPSEAEIVAISAPWLTDEHPDPWGDHLAHLGPPLLSLLQAHSHPHSPISRVVVFWDYLSLFQEVGGPRTPAEHEAFTLGLTASAVLFAHSRVNVWLQTAPPLVLPEYLSATERGFAEHHTRGFCVWERQLSSLLKEAHRLLDIGVLYSSDVPPAFDDFQSDVVALCVSQRPPPASPSSIAEMLYAMPFYSPADREQAIAVYAHLFEIVAAQTDVLLFGGMHWGEAEAAMLAHALPYFKRLSYLDVSHNPLGEEAVEWLAAALPSRTVKLNLTGVLTKDGRRAVREEVIRAACAHLHQAIPSPADHLFKLHRVYTRGYDELFMVAIVGDAGTGKSSIRSRFTEGYFNEATISTVGVDFSAVTVLHRGCEVHVQIWDAAGDRRLRTADENHFYRRVHGVVLVFDLQDRCMACAVPPQHSL